MVNAMIFTPLDLLFAQYDERYLMKSKSHSSIASRNSRLESLQIKLQRVLLALCEIDLEDEREYLALAAIDLAETYLDDLRKLLDERT